MPTKTNRLQRIDGAYHFDFRPTSDYRQAQTSPGQRKIAKVADFLSDHRAVKKDHSVQLLILGGNGHLFFHIPLAQESLDVISSQGRRLLPVVKEDKPANPGCLIVGLSSPMPRIPAVRQWIPQAGAAGGVNAAAPRRVV